MGPAAAAGCQPLLLLGCRWTLPQPRRDHRAHALPKRGWQAFHKPAARPNADGSNQLPPGSGQRLCFLLLYAQLRESLLNDALSMQSAQLPDSVPARVLINTQCCGNKEQSKRIMQTTHHNSMKLVLKHNHHRHLTL
jgi:hypothetical protein